MLKNIKFLKKILSTENLLIFIISLIPLAIIIGPLIADLFISLLSFYYLILIFYKKKTYLLKNKIFIFFLVFYIYLLLNTFLISNIYNEVWLNVLFYFRFFIFVFAASEIISKNFSKLFFIYIVTAITILTTLIDGYFQFIFEKNLFGFEKLRPDRVSGFFNDDLVLGSFLFKIIPVLLFFTIIYKEKKFLFYSNLGIVFFSVILTYLTGDRAAFFLLIIFLFTYLILLNIKNFYKFISIIISIIVFMSIQFINPTIFDRYFTQTLNQLYTKDNKLLPYYLPIFETAIKISNSNKIFGLGPKSFRYYCSKPEFITYYSKYKIINNKELVIDLGWKKDNQPFRILEFFFKENDIINKGDLLFTYTFNKNNKILKFYSDKAGRIVKINKQSEYFSGNRLAHIDPSIFNIQNFTKQPQDGCSTHPHNFYLQLLAETGYVGTFLIFGLFFLIFLKILKYLILLFSKKNNTNQIDIIFISFYFALLFPISTSGNFFNNWLNITSFYPLIFYLLNKKKINNV